MRSTCALLTVPAMSVQELPSAPRELVVELSRRYIYLYQTITGQPFQPASTDADAMSEAVHSALAQL